MLAPTAVTLEDRGHIPRSEPEKSLRGGAVRSKPSILEWPRLRQLR
jgi:hypothetical protein